MEVLHFPPKKVGSLANVLAMSHASPNGTRRHERRGAENLVTFFAGLIWRGALVDIFCRFFGRLNLTLRWLFERLREPSQSQIQPSKKPAKNVNQCPSKSNLQRMWPNSPRHQLFVRDVSWHLPKCGGVGSDRKCLLFERTPRLLLIRPPEVPHNNKHGTT